MESAKTHRYREVIKRGRTLDGGCRWKRKKHPLGVVCAYWPIMRTILQRSALE